MAKYSENPITSSDTNWNEIDPSNGLPWSGKSIREFQKAKNKETELNTATKIGASYFDSSTMTMYYFSSEENKEAWLSGAGDNYVLSSVPFNFTSVLTQLVLTNRLPDTNVYFTTTSTEAILSLGIVSQRKGITDPSWSDVNEDFYVSVDLDKGSTGNYVNILSKELVLNGNDFSINVRKYLATGSNRVRVSVLGIDSGTTKNLVYTVNLTTMYLSASKFAWYTPFIQGTDFYLGGMNIGGSLNKELKIRVKNEALGYDQIHTKNLGSATYITSAYYYNELVFPETGTGIYNVDIWLDANGLESDHLNYNLMFISEEDSKTAQLITINEVAEKALNYSDSYLFSYAIYSGGSSSGSPRFKVSFNGETLVEETLIQVATIQSLRYSIPLEIETEITGGIINIEAEFGNKIEEEVVLDNSASFPALADSVFYLNPASRNNSQENKEQIINQVDQISYNATWEGLSWVDGVDGWTEDENGRNCLLLPAGCKVNVDYKPLSSFAGKGKTVEFAFRVKNVADYEESIINLASSEDNNWKGLKITPKKIYLRSSQLKDDKAQSYPIKDEELVHVIVTIIRDYKNYGNIAQIYVNGGTRCSFSYTVSDDFSSLSNLIIGSETTDIYLYKMRVYDIGFEWPSVVQNFINCLPSAAEKVAVWSRMNEILDDSYNISYDAVKDSYNTMVIEMLGDAVLPDLLHPAGGQCNLNIKIHDPLPGELDTDFASLFSGIDILDQTIEGQGTTAMTYFRWNFRWKLSSTYNKRRITAKKNVASSMHSHKMGATRMYNDLHRAIVGNNETSGRVAVFQYPVLAFTKTMNELGEWDYNFIGLYTVGPDKGDKTTFGYDSKIYKDTVIHMEGTDHTPMAVGMDYPWSEIRYSAAKEGFGAISKSGAIATAWEVGMAGDLSPDESSDEAAVMEMIESEFKPAYEVAYNNSPFILGVTETLDEINAQKTEWRKKTLASGKSYTELEFWTDGTYDLYYWNIQNETYQPNGVNLLTDLGISSADLEGMNLEEKNNYFIEARKNRFKAQWGNYWNIEDTIFCYTFLLIFAATDNFKKNSYPYKFDSLNNGGKWRWRQDDLDTLADINNQGFSSKEFSVLIGDKTSSGSVYRGDNSVFWSLVGMTQGDLIKNMVHYIFDAMADKSTSGQNTLEKILGYVKGCMWDFAQNYFPESAYNIDAGWTYEEAWKLSIDGKYNNDVDPLGQSLGSHYEAEKDWFELRTLFIASYFNYGPFATDNGDDTSTGQISFRASSGKTYNITPVIDFNPTILVGQSDLATAGERIKAGETASVIVPDMGNNDTHVYIQGADWYSDLGDLKDLAVSADNPVLTVSSKRMRTLKLGDEVAESITTNVRTLRVGDCPSLSEIDARNVSTLTGTIDLKNCPRLTKALFGGTSAGEIMLPKGSKITEFELPNSLTNLSLVNLPSLDNEGLKYGELNALTYIRLENNAKIDGFAMMKATYEAGSPLINIRIIGFDYDGTSSDVALLAKLANGGYFGIDADGSRNPNIIPVIEGTLNIAGSVYEDDAKVIEEKYGAGLVLNVTGGYYIKFEDPEFQKLIVKTPAEGGYGDGIGVTQEQLDEVTEFKSNQFASDTEVRQLTDLYKFTNLKKIGSGAFGSNVETIIIPDSVDDCNFLHQSKNVTTKVIAGKGLKQWAITKEYSKLPRVVIPDNITSIYNTAFMDCSSLKKIALGSGITEIKSNAFTRVTLDELYLQSLENYLKITFNSIWNVSSNFFMYKGIPEEIKNNTEKYGNIVVDYNWDKLEGTGDYADKGEYEGKRQLVTTEMLNEALKDESITEIKNSAFLNCTQLEGELVIPSNVTSIGSSAFSSCSGLTNIEIPNSVTSISNNVFYNCISLTNVNIPNSVVSIGEQAFIGCSGLTSVEIPNSVTSIGYSAFNSSGLTSIVIPDGITSIEGRLCYSCKSLINVNIPDSVITVGVESFSECWNVENVILGNSIVNIERMAFRSCLKLKSIVIPDSVTSIGISAFYNCNKLSAVVCKAIVPPTLGTTVFLATNTALQIYVPDQSVEAYKSAEGWLDYTDKIKPLSDYTFKITPNGSCVEKETQITVKYEGQVITPIFSIESDVATIDENGLLVFSDYGTATVTITYNGESVARVYQYSQAPIENGVALQNNGTTTANASMSTVGFVTCNPNTQIKWGVTGGTLGVLCEYKEDGTFVDYWGAQSNPRTINVTANSTKVKASFSTANLADAYIYDVTNGVYLWKGDNVES